MNETNLLEDQPIAWTPTPEVIERAQLTKFMRQVGVSTWDELYAYSINDVEKFTAEVLRFLDIKFDPPYEKLLDLSGGVEFPNWFATGHSPQRRGDAENAEAETRPVGSVPGSEPGAIATGFPSHAGLNITEMCLDRWQTDEMKDQPAVICEGEDGRTTSTSYAILLREVEYAARGLKSLGFSRGDAIGIHLPMIVETVIALLAVNRIGAIAVPVFSGYGIDAISSRLNAVGAKALFTCDGFTRRGKLFNAFDIAVEAVAQCPSIKNVFVANAGNSIDNLRERTADERFIGFDDLITLGENPKDDPLEPTFAEDPLIILYTSGTTGKPKGIAHTHASFPIKAAQDMAFGTDVGKGTRISWYTDIGWMMGPWLIYGALINGATICIYDGAPDYPTPDRMWEFCAKHKVEVLGISPTLIRSLAAGDEAANSPPYEGGVADPTPFVGTDGVVLSPPDEVVDANAENHPTAKAAPLLRKEGSKKARLVGMMFEKVEAKYDENGKRSLVPTGEPEVFYTADDVLIAVGQENSFPWIERNVGVDFDKWEMPVVDKTTFQSMNPKVFFGGDAAFGPENVITAVAHGHQAAVSIDLFCSGKNLLTERLSPFVNLVSQKMGIHEWAYDSPVDEYNRLTVPQAPKDLTLKDRKREVELGFDPLAGYEEAKRCLNCDVQTVFEAPKCIECDACVDICPTSCITFTADGDESDLRKRTKVPALNTSQDIYVADGLKTGRIMVKDEDVCLHCGLCAERCPTAAWDMQKFWYDVTKAGEVKYGNFVQIERNGDR